MRLGTGSFVAGYFVLGRLGEGPVASAYRVYDETLGREAALKLFPASLAGDLERARGLRHPNLLPVYDFGQVQDRAWVLTELLEGGSLRERLAGPLPLDEAVRLLSPLASALDHLHQQGVVHGAIRPERIRLTAYGTPILGGLEMADISGSADYWAPERCQGEPAATWSDIYSFGVLAYELLTARVPFLGAPEEVAAGHVSLPAPPAGQPREVEAALHRALAKNPAVRFPTAGDFVQALSGGAEHAAEPDTQRLGPLARLLRLRAG